jgi:hypothetical protein
VETEYLFGSRVRAGVLETLAGTSKPLSAYRVAKAIGAQPIQVLTILKALRPEVVRHDERGWQLVNEPLRRFFRDRQSRREAERRLEKDELLMRLGKRARADRGRS